MTHNIVSGVKNFSLESRMNVAQIGNYEVNREVYLAPGFSQLQWYLARHAEISKLQLLLMMLLQVVLTVHTCALILRMFKIKQGESV